MRREQEIRQEVERQIRHEVTLQLNHEFAHEIARAIKKVERQIELGKDLQRLAGYLSGLKFAATLIELQALQHDDLSQPLLQIGSDSETKCEAV